MKELVLGEGILNMNFSKEKYPETHSELDRCYVAFTIEENKPKFIDLGHSYIEKEELDDINKNCDVLLTITNKDGLNLLINKLNNLKLRMEW